MCASQKTCNQFLRQLFLGMITPEQFLFQRSKYLEKEKHMLQINCPKCSAVIKSPYLAELSSTHCSNCNEDVTVKDIYVATKGFTMHRDDLLNRISRFQKLLSEVEKEIRLLEGNETVSKTTQNNINNFYATLQELLIGARNNFRLDVRDELAVEMGYDDQSRTGRLVNLSCEGASLEFDGAGGGPRNKTEIKLQFALPGVDDPLSLQAKVAWIREVPKGADPPKVKIGAKFINPDEHVRNTLWHYIVANSAEAEA